MVGTISENRQMFYGDDFNLEHCNVLDKSDNVSFCGSIYIYNFIYCNRNNILYFTHILFLSTGIWLRLISMKLKRQYNNITFAIHRLWTFFPPLLFEIKLSSNYNIITYLYIDKCTKLPVRDVRGSLNVSVVGQEIKPVGVF